MRLTHAELTNIFLAGKQKHDQTNPPPRVGLHNTVSSVRRFVWKKLLFVCRLWTQNSKCSTSPYSICTISLLSTMHMMMEVSDWDPNWVREICTSGLSKKKHSTKHYSIYLKTCSIWGYSTPAMLSIPVHYMVPPSSSISVDTCAISAYHSDLHLYYVYMVSSFCKSFDFGNQHMVVAALFFKRN